MKIYQGFLDARLRPANRTIAIGVFDGLHRGHQKIIKKAKDDARRARRPLCVVTFDPHPETVLRPSAACAASLLSLRHRLMLLRDLGVQECLLVRFDRKFSKLPHEKFLREYLLGRLGMRALFVGRGFRYGRRGQGDVGVLRLAGASGGFRVHEVAPLQWRRRVISSTWIRQMIHRGDFKTASKLLGRSYCVIGTVEKGEGRGRQLGFPTANLNPHHEALPREGVYAAWARVGSKAQKAVVHIGKRPTFDIQDPSLEVHLLGYRKSLYRKEIKVEFERRLRGIKKFASAQALRSAIQRDVQLASRILGSLQAQKESV